MLAFMNVIACFRITLIKKTTINKSKTVFFEVLVEIDCSTFKAGGCERM